MANKTAKMPMCDPVQYEILTRCIKKKNFTEWDLWRENNPKEKIRLVGADFKNALIGVIHMGTLKVLTANLSGADLTGANFERANLGGSNFQGANLFEANLKDALLNVVDLRGASLEDAKLNRANLTGARLNGTSFEGSHLEGATVHFTQVDSETYFKYCSFDKDTDFTGTGLDSAGIDPGLKAAFKDNIRRIHWQGWLDKERKKGKRLAPWVVERFWKGTDFGSSTHRIIMTFFKLAFRFAVLYWFAALPTLLYPQWQGIIEGLWQGEGWIGVVQTFFRAVYFSIVTMTTLGFGDMYAVEGGFWASFFGNIFLSIQVLIGYVLLGALITRLGILFIGEAPAAAPSPAKANGNKED